jgi:hypothetical protein
VPNVSDADDERHYEIFRGVTTDGGASWSWTPVTANSDTDNLRPIIPKEGEGRRVVLWQRGDFETYTDYNTDIVGIITDR